MVFSRSFSVAVTFREVKQNNLFFQTCGIAVGNRAMGIIVVGSFLSVEDLILSIVVRFVSGQ